MYRQNTQDYPYRSMPLYTQGPQGAGWLFMKALQACHSPTQSQVYIVGGVGGGGVGGGFNVNKMCGWRVDQKPGITI